MSSWFSRWHWRRAWRSASSAWARCAFSRHFWEYCSERTSSSRCTDCSSSLQRGNVQPAPSVGLGQLDIDSTMSANRMPGTFCRNDCLSWASHRWHTGDVTRRQNQCDSRAVFLRGHRWKAPTWGVYHFKTQTLGTTGNQSWRYCSQHSTSRRAISSRVEEDLPDEPPVQEA